MTFARWRKNTEKGVKMEPFLEPKSPKSDAGAPRNRSGADSGTCGRGGGWRGDAETHPEAKIKKKAKQGVRVLVTTVGYDEMRKAAGEVRRVPLQVRQESALPASV